jgi:AraC-like DNA-binding protein
VSGSSYLLWAATPTLVGAAYFSRPSAEEWTSLVAASDVARHSSLRPPYDAVIDAGALDTLTTEAFDALVDYLDFVRAYAPLVRRVAIVRPRGIVGAALAGLFYEAVETYFVCALFQEANDAFTWLGRSDAAPVAAEVAALVDVALGTPDLLRKVRAYLASVGGRGDLRHAARTIGMAERSLQRGLQEAGTTFRAEGDRARLALAERLLLEDDAKVETLARKSGFNSASHLARVFRRHTGETPAEFRRRRRT